MVASRSSSTSEPMPQMRRDDHERQRARREPVEEVAARRRGARRCPTNAIDAGDDRGADRAAAEVLAHLGVAEAVGVPHEVDRGEVRAHRDREHAAEDRRGVDPTRPRVAGLAAGRHPARRDRAGDRAHAERHEHRRRARTRRRSCGGRACACTALRNAKLEPRSTMPSAASVSGTNSVSVIDANASRERGPQHDEAEDQPHVVRLPHRTDRVVDRARAGVRPARRRRRRGPRSRRRSRRRRTARTR